VKAISLWQPWASALFALKPDGQPIKPHETRSWALPDWAVGVEIAIHAAKRDTQDERDFWCDTVIYGDHQQLYADAFATLDINRWDRLPRGCIIGTVVFLPSWKTLGQINASRVDEIASEWGNYSLGRHAWPTKTRTPFKEPIPCIGRQGFFNWEPK
jgi:hypothetical protein